MKMARLVSCLSLGPTACNLITPAGINSMLEEVCASKGMDYKQFAEGLKKKEQWHVEARHPPSAFSFAMTHDSPASDQPGWSSKGFRGAIPNAAWQLATQLAGTWLSASSDQPAERPCIQAQALHVYCMQRLAHFH